MANDVLGAAKAAKNDEFYTQLADVEREMYAYINQDPDVFRGKTVLLPCDDPEWSAFTSFFVQKFDELGLQKLISTSFAPCGAGKLYVVKRDRRRKKTDFNSIEIYGLEGDGDFRSGEVTQLRDESDFVITNPPFSLFREFVAWIREGGQRFSVIGNHNAVTYREIFPLIKSREMWLGATGYNNDMVFRVPEGQYVSPDDKAKAARLGYVGDNYTRMGNTAWFTSIDHGRRYSPISLLTMEQNRLLRARASGKAYRRYENYSAIEVPATSVIPSDYKGPMGVPIGFLDKYCPSQFKILGITEQNGRGMSGGLFDEGSKCLQPLIDGQKVYARIFIQAK